MTFLLPDLSNSGIFHLLSPSPLPLLPDSPLTSHQTLPEQQRSLSPAFQFYTTPEPSLSGVTRVFEEDQEDQEEKELTISSREEIANSLNNPEEESSEEEKIVQKKKKMSKMVADMLARDVKGAPKFRGKGKELEDFWAMFEALADGCNVEDKDKAKTVLRYVKRREDRELWRSMDGFEGMGATYVKWKEAVINAYALEEREFQRSFGDLLDFVKDSAYNRISTKKELSSYYCKYLVIANPLTKEKTITKDQKNLYFWKGLHPKTKQEI
jgi:hypothetical protein